MIIGGDHTRYLAFALRGLEAQRQATEHNIANVETPGFLAHRVSFENSLRSAMQRGRPATASMTTSRSNAPTRVDSSNVDLASEVTDLEINGLRQRLMTQALNAHFSRLRTTIGR